MSGVTPGRVVRYGVQGFVALVVGVNPDETVNLRVFLASGDAEFGARRVPFSEAPARHAWSWPPHVTAAA